MRKDEDGRNARAQQEAAEDRLYVDPAKLRNTSDLTPVDQCRSPERKKVRGDQNPPSDAEVNSTPHPSYYASEILVRLLETHGAKSVILDFLGSETTRSGVRFSVDEGELPALNQFFEGLRFVFDDIDGYDVMPETHSVYFQDEDGLYPMVTHYLSQGMLKDGTPLLDLQTFKEPHDHMLKSYVDDIETPRWRDDFARIAQSTADVLPEDLQAAREAFADLPYPESCKLLAQGLHAAASASQEHLRENAVPDFQNIVGYSVTHDFEEGMTNFELLIPDLDEDEAQKAWDHLENFVEDLECFPEINAIRRTRYFEERREDGVPVVAGYVFSCRSPRLMLRLLDQYYQAYNLKGPEEVCTLERDQFLGENQKFDPEEYNTYFNYNARRGEGLLDAHPGALGFLPAKSFSSKRSAEAALSMAMSALVAVSIKRIRDVVNTELGLPSVQRNGMNLIN